MLKNSALYAFLLLIVVYVGDIYAAADPKKSTVNPTQAFIYCYNKIFENLYNKAPKVELNNSQHESPAIKLNTLWSSIALLQIPFLDLKQFNDAPDETITPNKVILGFINQDFNSVLLYARKKTGMPLEKILQHDQMFEMIREDCFDYAKLVCIVRNLQFETRLNVSVDERLLISLTQEFSRKERIALDTKDSQLRVQEINEELEQLWNRFSVLTEEEEIKSCLETKRQELLVRRAIDEKPE